MSKSKVVHTSVVNMQKNVGAALITKCEVPTPDGQTSKDPVNRVARGRIESFDPSSEPFTRSHNHLSCTSITKSHMYYHEELAFTINKGKCAGKATGDAGSIPACESKKTKRGGAPTGARKHRFPGLSIRRYFTDASAEYPNPSITCQSQRLEGTKAIPYLKREG